jgi:hypothetical protein
VAALAKLTKDRELALTALVTRAVERERASVSSREVLDTERRIIATRFGGSAAAYRAALAEVGASLSVARGVIGDELRSNEIRARLATSAPSKADVTRFRSTYASVLARGVVASPAPSWLPEGSGLALATSAPEVLFRIATRRQVRILTAEGTFSVRALGATSALGAFPSDLARPAIIRELRSARRSEAYSAWTMRAQNAAETRLVCERDRLPQHGVVALSSFATFLSLHEAWRENP